MADAVTSVIVGQSATEVSYHLTNISDGTGEASVVKADISGLLSTAGIAPVSLDILSVRWSIQGMTSVRLIWGTTSPVVAMVLSGGGYEDYTDVARGTVKPNCLLASPRTATGEADILLTTIGAVSGGSYDITLTLRKQPV